MLARARDGVVGGARARVVVVVEARWMDARTKIDARAMRSLTERVVARRSQGNRAHSGGTVWQPDWGQVLGGASGARAGWGGWWSARARRVNETTRDARATDRDECDRASVVGYLR